MLTILPENFEPEGEERNGNGFTSKDGRQFIIIQWVKGFPVVLIHTAYDNYSVFNDVAKALAKSFQVVLIDLRGHGYSDKPRNIEFHEFADDVIALY